MSVSVSVIIPTYNRVELLPRALHSVFAQTRSADEVIVVDDGSSDQTAQVVGQRFARARYLRQSKNSGVSAARNRGICSSTGTWIALLDSDDEWVPNKLERQLRGMPRGLYIGHTDEIWMRDGKRVNQMKKHAKSGGWIYQRCLPLCAISPSAVIIHRSVFERIGLFDESFPACEDYDFWLRACARFEVQFIAEPLVIKYGGHQDQLSRRYWGMDRFRIQALEKMINDDSLSPCDRRATLEMLLTKLAIYLHGASKRNKRDAIAVHRRKQVHYSRLLAALEV